MAHMNQAKTLRRDKTEKVEQSIHSGRLVYRTGESGCVRALTLTYCGDEDGEILRSRGLAELRRYRLLRLLDESSRQGVKLDHRQLEVLLLSSSSTIKRDLREIRKRGTGTSAGIREDYRGAKTRRGMGGERP